MTTSIWPSFAALILIALLWGSVFAFLAWLVDNTARGVRHGFVIGVVLGTFFAIAIHDRAINNLLKATPAADLTTKAK